MDFSIFHSDHNTTYHTFQSPNCDMVSPISHFGGNMQALNLHLDMIKIENHPSFKVLSPVAKLELGRRLEMIEKQKWEKQYGEITADPLPGEIIQLFETNKKKAQQKLLKTLVFKTGMFMSIPIYAWEKYRMLYSKFTVDHLPKELDHKTISVMLHKKSDGGFDYTGETDLSMGEMQVAIDKRNRIISEFIGDEENWFCFFRTMAGIKGTEIPHIGEPHLHFISSAWGIKRRDVIENLASYRYSLNAETIRFEPTAF
jgi:hypothetical protein